MFDWDPTHEPNPPGSAGDSNDADQRQLALVKRGQRYVFQYLPGQEPELLQRLANLARDPACPLGMFDAAVLSHQVGQRLSQQVEQLLRS